MRFARRLPNESSRIDDVVIRLGIPPTLEAAPAVAARELGYFARHGLQVRLCREPGWATTRDKLLQREVDAAIGPAAFLYSLYRGIGVVRQPCLTALLLPRGGCAITLGRALHAQRQAHPSALFDLVRRGGLERRLTFAIAPAPGPEGEYLDRWLRDQGLDPVRDVRRVSLPPAVVLEHLRRGSIDGFCQAEPWSSAAETAGLGGTVPVVPTITPSGDDHDVGVFSGFFDRALLVLRDFAECRPEEHVRLVAALIEGARFCEVPENRGTLSRLMALPRYCGVDAEAVGIALARLAPDRTPAPDASLAPTASNGRRILDGPEASRGAGRAPAELIRRVFRNDLFERALALLQTPTVPAKPDSEWVPGHGISAAPPEHGPLLPCLASAAAAFGVASFSAC